MTRFAVSHGAFIVVADVMFRSSTDLIHYKTTMNPSRRVVILVPRHTADRPHYESRASFRGLKILRPHRGGGEINDTHIEDSPHS